MTRLILIRHANTFEPGETPYWVGCREDLELSNSGREQLLTVRSKIGKIIGDETPVTISSPLKRARSTANAISNAITIDERLTELDFGPWSGKTDAEIVAKYGEVELKAWRESSEIPSSWGLSEKIVTPELSNFLSDCSNSQLTIAVTSNGRLKLIGKMLGGAGGWNVKTANYCEIEMLDKQWRIKSWNL